MNATKMNPDTSPNQSVPNEGSELDHPTDQVLTPVVEKLRREVRDPRNERLDKKQMLEKLVGDIRKSKVKAQILMRKVPL